MPNPDIYTVPKAATNKHNKLIKQYIALKLRFIEQMFDRQILRHVYSSLRRELIIILHDASVSGKV